MFEIKLDKQPEHFLSKCENKLFERISGKFEILKKIQFLMTQKEFWAMNCLLLG